MDFAERVRLKLAERSAEKAAADPQPSPEDMLFEQVERQLGSMLERLGEDESFVQVFDQPEVSRIVYGDVRALQFTSGDVDDLLGRDGGWSDASLQMSFRVGVSGEAAAPSISVEINDQLNGRGVETFGDVDAALEHLEDEIAEHVAHIMDVLASPSAPTPR